MKHNFYKVAVQTLKEHYGRLTWQLSGKLPEYYIVLFTVVSFSVMWTIAKWD